MSEASTLYEATVCLQHVYSIFMADKLCSFPKLLVHSVDELRHADIASYPPLYPPG